MPLLRMPSLFSSSFVFVFAVFFAAACSFLLLQVLLPYLHRCLLDDPNSRSSHRYPVPRGGGISFVVVSLIFSVVAFFSGRGLDLAALIFISAPLGLVGLLDDRFNMPASWRYSVQLFTATLVLALSPLVQSVALTIAFGSWLPLAVLFLLLIAVTAVINFTNFMDGLDGLVAGCMTVIIALLAILLDAPFSLWALVGSLLGFLLWNWSPAKVFMGDVGSTFLGAVFAGLVLQASSWTDAFGFLLVATPLLGDACLCVIRRLLDGQSVFEAHRLHLYQRLHQAGWSHGRVSLTYISGTAVLAFAMLSGGWLWVFSIAVVELMFGFWLDHHFAVPFALASKS